MFDTVNQKRCFSYIHLPRWQVLFWFVSSNLEKDVSLYVSINLFYLFHNILLTILFLFVV